MNMLYQYTSVDALESILSNQTIRLNPLTAMDDLQEEMSQDSKAYGNCVFCSSWSAESKEMIPMWKMYGDDYSGVRIGLPPIPFKKYHYSSEEVEQYLPNPNKTSVTTYIPLEDLVGERYFILPTDEHQLLNKIVYVEDVEKLIPQLWNKTYQITDAGMLQIFDSWNYGALGTYKNDYWNFQKEYRYLLHIWPIPFNTFNMAIKIIQAFNDVGPIKQLLKQISSDESQNAVKYYDMKISDEALEKMDITLGVKISDENRQKVHGLIQSINKNITIKESDLNGLLRLERI